MSERDLTEPTPENLRKASKAVYLACEESVAKDISNLLRWSANEIERLTAALRSSQGGTELLWQAHKSLAAAGIGSCTCLTKSPEGKWHDADCRYLKIANAMECIESITKGEGR